jgi:hypothetical protein
MQVFHTAGLPPRYGSNIFAMRGCTEKSKRALIKRAAEKRRDATLNTLDSERQRELNPGLVSLP